MPMNPFARLFRDLPTPVILDITTHMPRLKALQRREQLIDVATRIFAKWGFSVATTAKIATAAGVTEPILYRHFKSKQDLFVAITRAMSEQTIRRWHELIEHCSSSTEKIRKIARQFPSHIKENGDAYHVIHGALATTRDRKVLKVLKEHYSEIERFFCGIIADGQKADEFNKDLDPNVPAWQLINIGIGYAMIALNLNQFDHFSVEAAIEYILRGLKK